MNPGASRTRSPCRFVGIVLPFVACATGCDGGEGGAGATARFAKAGSTGVEFVHDHGGFGRRLFPEIVAGGASLLDYDGDGDLDVWFAQGAPLPGHPDPSPRLDELYRNDGGLRFTNVTAETGAGEPGYTYASACPDVDGDGDVDLFLCNFGRDVLLVNDGKGRFRDVAASAQIGSDGWTTCASFADLDRDGDLDCYVGDYVVFDFQKPRGTDEAAFDPERSSYPHPDSFQPASHELFRNDGGRDDSVRFTRITAEAGMGRARGKALAVVPVDYDDDGDVDLFVANDHVPSFLWRNDTELGGPIRLVEVGFEVGVAQDGDGRSESCMGSDAADVDNDGDFDLFSANMSKETNTLRVNRGRSFTDDTDLAGLGAPSYFFVGFGARFFDQDLDGDLDLAIANGHVFDNVDRFDPHQSFAQVAHFYENAGRGKFRLVPPESAGPYFTERHVGRGLATGDLDDDGDTDLVFANWGERPEILENTAIRKGTPPSWIGVSLRARGANTQAIGARVECWSGGERQVAEVRGAASYAAWNDTRLVFGLGATDEPGNDKLVIRWPDGSRQEIRGLAPDRYHPIRQE